MASIPRQANVGGTDSDVLYAIGDVHGCFNALCALLERIKVDILTLGNKSVRIVFLGDLIDRGPKSYSVVEFLKDFRPSYADVVFLNGNHEHVFLEVVQGDISKLQGWFDFGGRECARSYGVKNLGEVYLAPEKVLKRLQNCVPEDHIEFLKTFKDYLIHGKYICVHAGIHPNKKLKSQTKEDMLWIRKRFIKSRKQHSHIVVHGHTIVPDVEIHSNRIALDTGAYCEGKLSAIRIENNDTKIISVSTAE